MMIQVRQAALTYQTAQGEVEALHSVSFDVEEGAFYSIVGPSGCGKSTLLGAIAGLEPLSGGEILVDGKLVDGPSASMGLMPQQDQLFPWRTIRDNVLLGLQIQKRNSPARRAHAMELLERYGLGEFAKCRPGQLSGGMRQRCALIRTLAPEPKILLLDEPFSALDYQTRLTVSADIHAILRAEGKTAVLVTHDIAEAVSLSDRVVVLSARPATVKAVHDLSPLGALQPMERRDAPEFHLYFNQIWKELEIHD